MRDLHRALWEAQGDARAIAGSLYDASEEIRCLTDEAACRERVTELIARAERQVGRLTASMARVAELRADAETGGGE